jgi:hypothetical protein
MPPLPNSRRIRDRSYASSGLQLTFIPDARSCASDCVGKGIIVAVETKEGFNLPAQLGVAGAVTIEKSALLIRRKIGSLVENALEFVPLDLMEQSNRHFNAEANANAPGLPSESMAAGHRGDSLETLEVSLHRVVPGHFERLATTGSGEAIRPTHEDIPRRRNRLKGEWRVLTVESIWRGWRHLNRAASHNSRADEVVADSCSS